MNGYPSLRLGFTGTPACPDEYEPKSTLEAAQATRLRLQVANAAVLIQFGEGIGGIQWGPEEPFYPVVGAIPRPFDAVRVRNYTRGQAAQVFLTAYPF